MRRYNAHSTYQARQVRWVVQNNTEWIITLDAGFVNEIPEYDYADWRRGKELLERGGKRVLSSWLPVPMLCALVI